MDYYSLDVTSGGTWEEKMSRWRYNFTTFIWFMDAVKEHVQVVNVTEEDTENRVR